jgi:ammonia channel protein AmtB
MKSFIICIFTKYCLDDTIVEDEMVGACSKHGVMGNVCKILVGTLEGKRSLRRLRCGWEDNIKMDLNKRGDFFTS